MVEVSCVELSNAVGCIPNSHAAERFLGGASGRAPAPVDLQLTQELPRREHCFFLHAGMQGQALSVCCHRMTP